MQYPLRITLHEGIIKTSINIDWPKILIGKNTKITKIIYCLGICMNHGAEIYRYENKRQILNNSGLSNIWIKKKREKKKRNNALPPPPSQKKFR